MTCLRKFLAPTLLSLLFASCDQTPGEKTPVKSTPVAFELHQGIKPLPTPFEARVASSEPRLKIFSQQTPKNQALIYHLKRVASLSHTLLYHQRHRHGLALKAFFEHCFTDLPYLQQTLSAEGYQEFIIFGLKFLDNAGVYNAGANLKYLLHKVSSIQLQDLLTRFAPETLSAQGRSEVSTRLY